MTELLGHDTSNVVGEPCYQVLCGTDVFGNRFCNPCCPVINMARIQAAIRRFEMHVSHVNRRPMCTEVAILSVGPWNLAGATIVHILRPVGRNSDSHNGTEPAGGRAPFRSSGDGDGDGADVLTSRERQLLALFAQGCGSRTIAERLDLSVLTVRNHGQNILRKLKVHNRVEAVALAQRARLI